MRHGGEPGEEEERRHAAHFSHKGANVPEEDACRGEATAQTVVRPAESVSISTRLMLRDHQGAQVVVGRG